LPAGGRQPELRASPGIVSTAIIQRGGIFVSKKVHIENNLEAEEVAGFLRALAAALEGGCPDCLQSYGLDLHDFNRIKLGLRKGETGELFLKITVKDGSLPAIGKARVRKEKRREDDPGRQEYRTLKKRMKASFAAIGRALQDGEKPEAGLMASFLADSRLMLTIPGYGDEEYGRYEGCCRNFETAAVEADPVRLQEASKELSACMKECHARFKK